MIALAISYRFGAESFIGSLLDPDDLWVAQRIDRAPESFCAPGMGILDGGHTLVFDA
jgi:hypothetical protein